jgi:hypothetical protein
MTQRLQDPQRRAGPRAWPFPRARRARRAIADAAMSMFLATTPEDRLRRLATGRTAGDATDAAHLASYLASFRGARREARR